MSDIGFRTVIILQCDDRLERETKLQTALNNYARTTRIRGSSNQVLSIHIRVTLVVHCVSRAHIIQRDIT